MIRAVEAGVAALVAFHQAIQLAFAEAVAGVNLVGQHVGGGFRAGLGLARLREQGIERGNLGVEVGEVGLGECAGGGDGGEVGCADVQDGGAVGEAVGFGLVEEVGRAEIHGVEEVVLVLLVGPRGDCATDDGGGGTHGLAGEAFVFGDAGGGAGLFEFLGADGVNGGGEVVAGAGEGCDGLPDGFEGVQNAEDGDEHLSVGLLFDIHNGWWWLMVNLR